MHKLLTRGLLTRGPRVQSPHPVTFLGFLRSLALGARTMDLSINEGTLVVTGGPGDTPQTAIAIKKTPRGLSAAGAELMLLQKWFGERGKRWTLKSEAMVQLNGKTYDAYEVVLMDGSERRLYFDVTEWLSRLRGSAASANQALL